MNPESEAHLNRVKTAIDPAQTAQNIETWLGKNSFLEGKPFSFVDHEYQQVILRDKAKIKFCKKCSQIGISELSVRRAIAITQLYRDISCIYILPTATFAGTFSSTRFSSALENTPTAKENLYKTDSTSVKRFVGENYLYMKGASTSAQAISIPCDFLVVDEKDFCESQDILSAFTSRMTHSKYKDQFHFSTPTVGGYGISEDFDGSMQFVEIQRCNHCNHTFIADYYEHVKLPGFNVGNNKVKGPANVKKTDRILQEFNFLNKELLTKFPINEAYLACPNCHKPCDQDIKYREFVCVNPDSNRETHGYQITPFSAPKQMPPSEMIKTSTGYKAVKDFVNNCLGLEHDDSTTGLSETELKALFRSDINYPELPPYQISGTDMGGTCAHFTAYPAPNGHIRIMLAERIPLHKFNKRYLESLGQSNVVSSVIDLMPYTDMVAAMQARCPSLFACVFTRTRGVELYNIREKEEDENKASYGVRQINAKKNALFDFMVNMIREGQISFAPSTFQEKDTIIKHLMDMKRIEIKNLDGEKEYVWRKSSKGLDHYFHALAYLVLANFLKGLSTGLAPLPMLAGKFTQKKVL